MKSVLTYALVNFALRWFLFDGLKYGSGVATLLRLYELYSLRVLQAFLTIEKQQCRPHILPGIAYPFAWKRSVSPTYTNENEEQL